MTIGGRLREERKRLKMTQAAFAEEGGIGVSTLKLYEGDDRDPGALFLEAVGKTGVDVQYVVTAIRSKSALAADERMLLEGYRALDPATRKHMLAFALTESGPVAIQKKIQEATVKARGKHAIAITGDNNNVGNNKTVNVTASGRGAQAAGKSITNRGKNGEQ